MQGIVPGDESALTDESLPVKTIFMQHFQKWRAHFTVPRLGRKYDAEFVRGRYEALEPET